MGLRVCNQQVIKERGWPRAMKLRFRRWYTLTHAVHVGDVTNDLLTFCPNSSFHSSTESTPSARFDLSTIDWVRLLYKKENEQKQNLHLKVLKNYSTDHKKERVWWGVQFEEGKLERDSARERKSERIDLWAEEGGLRAVMPPIWVP